MESGESVSIRRSKGSCNCSKDVGRWQEIPAIRERPSVVFLNVDWPEVKKRFGFLPTGIKIPFRFQITATISGKLECACSDEPGCKEVDAFSVSASFITAIPVPVEIVGIALRAVPILGQVYTAAHVAYVAAKITNALIDVSWAFQPAVRFIRDSADLICEGRFNPTMLVPHLSGIVFDVKL
jgi:hypothetical protein